MKAILKKYIPDFSVAFTMLVLLASITNLMNGDTRDGFILFILEAAGYLLIAVVIDYLLGKVNYKSYISQFLTETCILYPITMACGLYLHWFGWSFTKLILYTFLYLFIMVLLHYYFYRVSKKDAEEINELLKNRDE